VRFLWPFRESEASWAFRGPRRHRPLGDLSYLREIEIDVEMPGILLSTGLVNRGPVQVMARRPR
jgi:hypothetical protein